MRVNLSDDPGNDFQVLPAGAYVIELQGYKNKTSKEGNPMIECEFSVVDPAKYFNRRVWEFFPLTDNCRWKLNVFAKAVDFPDRKNPDGFDTDELFEYSIKYAIKANLTIDKYEGKENNKIKEYLVNSKSVVENVVEDDPFK